MSTNRHVYPVHHLDRPTSGILVFAMWCRISPRNNAG
ncbi:pseudouridine synthase [Marinobacter subterrani]